MEPAGIFAAESGYLERYVQVGVAGQKVISLAFPETPDSEADPEHEVLDRVFAYLEGAEKEFGDIEVGLTVPTDQRTVLERTRAIPYGTQISVAELATQTPGLDPEEEEDLQVVRQALAENPIPLLIPDHRVRDGPSGAPPGIEQKLRKLENL